jgi:hypothetical protein
MSVSADWPAHKQKLGRRFVNLLGLDGGLVPFVDPEALTRTVTRNRSAYEMTLIESHRALQWYNLWHEDRTSSAQGIEARVPFLDHRLVEFLAGIPEQRQAALFWDKRILRTAARRWMPAPFCERPKAGFIYSSDNSAIDRVNLDILKSVFPGFREKYLQRPLEFVRPQAIIQAFENAVATGTGHGDETISLLQMMALVVFQELCRSKVKPISESLRPPSLLRELRAVPAPAPARVAARQIPWGATDRPVLAPGIRVQLQMPDQVIFTRDEKPCGTFSTEHLKPVMDLVFLIGASTSVKARSVKELSHQAGIPLASAKKALELLSQEGWICKQKSRAA